MNYAIIIRNMLHIFVFFCGLRLDAAASSTPVKRSSAPQTIPDALRFIGKKYRPLTDIKDVTDLRKFTQVMSARHRELTAQKRSESATTTPPFTPPSRPMIASPSAPQRPTQTPPAPISPAAEEWANALSQLDWLAPGTLEKLSPDLFHPSPSGTDFDPEDDSLIGMLTEHFEKPIIYPATYEKAKQNFYNLILKFGRPGPSYTPGSLVKVEDRSGRIATPSGPSAPQDPVLESYVFSPEQVRQIEENFRNAIRTAPDRLPPHPYGRQWTPRELMCLQYVWTRQAQELDQMKRIYDIHALLDSRVPEQEHIRRAQEDIARALRLAQESNAQFDTRMATIKRAFGFGPEVSLSPEFSYPPLRNYTEQLQARLRRLQGTMRLQR